MSSRAKELLAAEERYKLLHDAMQRDTRAQATAVVRKVLRERKAKLEAAALAAVSQVLPDIIACRAGLEVLG